MDRQEKTPEELLGELDELQQQVNSLLAAVAERDRAHHVQRAIYRISEAALAAGDLDELYSSIHAIIAELMPARNFYITLYDSDADLFYAPYVVDEKEPEWPPYHPGKGLGA